jgi:hypothetical protein
MSNVCKEPWHCKENTKAKPRVSRNPATKEFLICDRMSDGATQGKTAENNYRISSSLEINLPEKFFLRLPDKQSRPLKKKKVLPQTHLT